MADSPVLRFPISGKKDEFYLLQVIPNGKQHPLDLRLVGTEGTGAYEVKLRHRRVNEWKAPSGHCTDEEWEQILISTLIEPDHVHARDIEIKADLQSESTTLNFRKNIQGITQRLGSIKLKEFDIVTDPKTGADNGPQLFDWCVAAIGSRARVLDDLAAATAKAEELEKSVNELKTQLEDIIKAKEDDERQLLEKFRDLLNEKKLKIRQQNRLLASADVNPDKLENVGASQNTMRKARASRGGKRKAAQESSDESDDGFTKMDVDQSTDIKEEPEDDQDMDAQETTDEEQGAETQSEDEDVEDPPEPPAKSTTKRKPTARSAASRRRASSSPKSSRKGKGDATPPTDDEDDDDVSPPRRTLPYQTKNRKPESPKTADDDETESDDEL
ncbi:hypothetical protein JX265_005164 [Neoarthrinium moseri]|uniref:XRCC4 coiled-coil domain-containing protein n=1 Tax=Neoarthrinium moseri TaxID=1658444 RepID=A0A9P9WPC9_9PEZI|nr:hypothetical protein JX266_010744 [Neoarthrinium moseri]KAI1873542.1 hypothetical protein JX265_005164 [Neoarthrinium moseri]